MVSPLPAGHALQDTRLKVHKHFRMQSYFVRERRAIFVACELEETGVANPAATGEAKMHNIAKHMAQCATNLLQVSD